MTETEKPHNVVGGELKAGIETLAPASDVPAPPAEQAVQVDDLISRTCPRADHNAG